MIIHPPAVSEAAAVWVPPKAGQTYGIGVVIRNEPGVFMAGLSKKMDATWADQGTQAAGLYGMSEAILISQQQEIDEIIIEGDLPNVLKIFKESRDVTSSTGLRVTDMANELRKFCSYEVAIVNRQGNRVATRLAQHANLIDNVFVWQGQAPEFIMPLLISDIRL
ncbi:unnamed protein product [Ilex paraguariensis]|uniref:RNase H type-1 domain-containing protein n=1 Tax=Ilex paraguariensis TaxID=185542 RepID=A0ABC8U3J4_9AQUA